ncbi:MAG TPA: LuxR C-terminal-related transcriptional regulator [Polyangiaceae bacterium]
MSPEPTLAPRDSVTTTPSAYAPSVWKGVLSGRYRITNWYDRDGRRYLVAKPNPARALRPLTDRQRRMLALRARGAALKVIAFEFGVSMGTVSRDLTLAMNQLGLESSADLAAVFGHV